MTEQKERLLQLVVEEAKAGKDFILPVHLDLHTLMCIVAGLQLALRHPANTGPSAMIVRDLIDQITARIEQEGYVATAQILRLGDNPENDDQYELLGNGKAIKCLACGMVSHNPSDVVNRYCGNCHKFHEDEPCP